MTKMRERGIEVVEMHNLLEETVRNPQALQWILERKITQQRRPRSAERSSFVYRKPGAGASPNS